MSCFPFFPSPFPVFLSSSCLGRFWSHNWKYCLPPNMRTDLNDCSGLQHHVLRAGEPNGVTLIYSSFFHSRICSVLKERIISSLGASWSLSSSFASFPSWLWALHGGQVAPGPLQGGVHSNTASVITDTLRIHVRNWISEEDHGRWASQIFFFRRGFASHIGYWAGKEDYYDHSNKNSVTSTPL